MSSVETKINENILAGGGGGGGKGGERGVVDESATKHDPGKPSQGETFRQRDLRNIWSGNESLPQTIQGRVHDLIADKALKQPKAAAVCAWDGQLSYEELDDLSTRLASHLVGVVGIESGVVIPLCFEKSMWTPVAMLGVMKAGGTSVAMDITLPPRRLQQIVDQSGGPFCLCSRENEPLAKSLGFATVVKVDRDVRILPKEVTHIKEVSPSAIVFVTYTSGSTGVPKGACISHANVCSAVHYQGSKLGFHAASRVLDFAPYSFDVAWSNVLHTLCAGGCLCIASSNDMLNDVEKCIALFEVDLINITPTTFATLTPKSSTLKVVLLSGERPNRHAIAQWIDKVDVKNTYGPAECTFKSAFASISSQNLQNIDIGRGVGSNTWIVEVTNHNRLVPHGQPGELLLEGPMVGQGYLNDPAQTAAAFVEDPPWLLKGRPGVPGRRGRLYKTGDLVQRNADGTLQFIGRKDAQVKIRGQRVELGEVEHHVRLILAEGGVQMGIVAEVITPRGSGNPMLVAFAAVGEEIGDKQMAVKEATRTLNDKLAAVMPAYMVPSAYLPTDCIPMTATGKTDRRRLREIGEAWTLEQLAALQSCRSERRTPRTPQEVQIQRLWSSVLGIDAGSIGADDSFLRVGGDSVAAMRLVAAARDQGMSLTVANVFERPQLCELAKVIEGKQEAVADAAVRATPFCWLDTEDVCPYLEHVVVPKLSGGMKTKNILDVLPTTDFQKMAIREALRDELPGRWSHFIADIPEDVNFERLQRACLSTIAYLDVLRMIFIAIDGVFWQVFIDQLDGCFDLFENNGSSRDFAAVVCHDDLQTKRLLGQSFVRFLAVKDPVGGNKLVFRSSHAQYDGISRQSVFDTIFSMYHGTHTGTPSPKFTDLLAYTLNKRPHCIKYWRFRMRESRMPDWRGSCEIPAPTKEPRRWSRLSVRAKIPHIADVSTASLAHAAVALALSRIYDVSEVVFGRLVTGRAMLPLDLQRAVGPALTELPVHEHISSEDTLSSVAIRIQRQFIQDSYFESIGMAELIEACTEWPETIDSFGWRCVFQPEPAVFTHALEEKWVPETYERELPPRPRPEITTSVVGDDIELRYASDSRAVPYAMVERLLNITRDILEGR